MGYAELGQHDMVEFNNVNCGILSMSDQSSCELSLKKFL
jgi:hypothetical protein